MKIQISIVLSVAGAFFAALPALAEGPQPLALVPQPFRVERGEGEFVLKKDTVIIVEKGLPDAAKIGKQLAERLNRSTGLALTVSRGDVDRAPPNSIRLILRATLTGLGAEGYNLFVTENGAAILAADEAGLFYGVQTMLQLLPPQIFSAAKVKEPVTWAMPAVVIEDRPRFPWRGLMLDTSRHFFNKDEIKNFIDVMAQHKLNRFHWHLTDDQGWRIEIKRYPKLTQVGAWRKDIGFGLKPKDSTAYGPDGRYGGFYTQDDIREIVAYAKDRYVTIVPEIEMPGHSVAALAAYPQFSCSGGPYSTDFGGGIHAGVYCAGNDAAFEFLQGVLAEVIELFPGKYVHVGGDEVPKANWKKCEKCQARIRQEKLAGENELQSWFIRRIEKFLNARGRTLIGWDEILEGGLAPNAAVMSWRGMGGGIAAANSGHDVVMTPTSHCYFDYYQAKNGEPKAIGGLLPLEKVYSFEPVPPSLAADKIKHILGAGGNLWSEYLPNYAMVQYMAYPRACAMAEVAWSDPNSRKWEDFSRRLASHLQRLKAQGVNYREFRRFHVASDP
jgi:hexosaminidase